MYAVVVIAGKQYKISPEAKIVVDKIAGDVGAAVQFDRVLLVNDGKKTSVGTPTVPGYKVEAKILEQGKGEKLDVRRYKSKVRYRKHIGFRPHQTTLQVLSIAKS